MTHEREIPESLDNLTKELDAHITRIHTDYVLLLRDLDAYRGKPVGDNVDKVNAILKGIQEKFYALYPALYFIATRYEFASNTVNGFNEFIDALKKAGAHQDNESPTSINT